MALNKICLLTEVSSQKIKQQRTVLNCREQSKTHPEHFLVVALESSGAYSGLSLGMPFFLQSKNGNAARFPEFWGMGAKPPGSIFIFTFRNFLKHA